MNELKQHFGFVFDEGITLECDIKQKKKTKRERVDFGILGPL